MSARARIDLAPGSSARITRGFREWLCEDAEGRLFAPPEFAPPMESIAEWCHKKAVKPVRITMRLHNAGDGVACETRKRISFSRVPLHVWFFDNPDPMETGKRHHHADAVRNLSRKMPGVLWGRLYGVTGATAANMSGKHGFSGRVDKIENR